MGNSINYRFLPFFSRGYRLMAIQQEMKRIPPGASGSHKLARKRRNLNLFTAFMATLGLFSLWLAGFDFLHIKRTPSNACLFLIVLCVVTILRTVFALGQIDSNDQDDDE